VGVRARHAWPLGVAAFGTAWDASDSLRHRREQGDGYALVGAAPHVGERGFLRAAEALTGSPISEGNAVELRVNGDEIFPTILETIEAAERTLCLETYIYWKGEIASEVADRLCRKASEGVEVRVVVDWVGSVKMGRKLLGRLDDAGVHVARFRPPKPYALRRLNNRTHRKLLIADGRTGMIGGVGIADEWTGNAEDPDHWRDTHVRVTGPVVRGLQGCFSEHWLEATGEALVGDDHLPPLDPVDDGGPMQLVRSRSGVGDTNAEALYYLAIASARTSLDLTAAYFAPRPAFVEALCDAARRDVAVRVLVPGPHIDKGFVRLAGRDAYDALLECGVEVHEYQPTMLHAKTLVVDRAWSSVGSVNFDNRSFQLHDEATLGVQSERFAGELTRCFERDLECSERIAPGRWERRAPRQRAAERVLKLARREL
jgi:cardiolipin synthase